MDFVKCDCPLWFPAFMAQAAVDIRIFADENKDNHPEPEVQWHAPPVPTWRYQ